MRWNHLLLIVVLLLLIVGCGGMAEDVSDAPSFVTLTPVVQVDAEPAAEEELEEEAAEEEIFEESEEVFEEAAEDADDLGDSEGFARGQEDVARPTPLPPRDKQEDGTVPVATAQIVSSLSTGFDSVTSEPTEAVVLRSADSSGTQQTEIPPTITPLPTNTPLPTLTTTPEPTTQPITNTSTPTSLPPQPNTFVVQPPDPCQTGNWLVRLFRGCFRWRIQ